MVLYEFFFKLGVATVLSCARNYRRSSWPSGAICPEHAGGLLHAANWLSGTLAQAELADKQLRLRKLCEPMLFIVEGPAIHSPFARRPPSARARAPLGFPRAAAAMG